ncbi:MAG: ATP-binding protein [Aquabacterium sp.]|uniref:hypothetical protein n=1 Tax=Aquabacterium sp. TaxID=1872578 RepID=UPI00121FEB7E|nr:hypothetical protein [Aquabacterium sp.]TAK89477.1 MAG: ATP-binding protein [Aquabacterium sp.]
MSLAGTRSSRGDIYQVCVAMEWAIRMIKDPSQTWMELDSTRIISGGIPAPVDDVIIGWSSGRETCCQCKKNQTGFTFWSVADIEDDLKKAAKHLTADPNSDVRFYSRADFGDLARLVDRAQQMPDLTAFLTGVPKSLQPELDKLTAAWNDALPGSKHDIHALLRRIRFELTRGLGDYEEHLKLDLAQHVTRVNDAYNTLWTVLDGLGARTTAPSLLVESHRITREDLLQILQDKGCAIAPPCAQIEIEGKLKSMSKIGREWRREIAGRRVERKAVADLMEATATNGSVLLTDGPGAGKTCILMQLVDELEARSDVATLFLQAREFADAMDQDDRLAMGLYPDIPALVSAMSQWKRTIVVVDSLDVLSLNRETHSLAFFLSLIDRLRAIPGVCVVVACRSFDLQYDRKLADRHWDRKVEIGQLDWGDVVEPLLCELGVDTADVDALTRELLGNARNLALFADVTTKSTRKNLSSAQELTEIYLDVVVANDPDLGTPAMVAIETMANEMLAQRRHQLRRSRVEASDDLLRRLLSNNVLFKSAHGDIGFGHQTLLDALAVRDAVRRGLNLLEFIRSLQPVPFIRPAIRAFFTHLRLTDRTSLIAQLRAVFDSDVAFHIKRLIAESYAACDPDVGDWSLIRHLFRNHPVQFKTIYEAGHQLAWHHFWMRHLVPMLEDAHDGIWLSFHFQRLQEWANDDPHGVFGFWTRFATSPHAKTMNLRAQFGFVVRGFKHLENVDAYPLLESLVSTPATEYDTLGNLLLQWARFDPRGDALLWRYITGDVTPDLTRDKEIEKRLHFDEGCFQKGKDLVQRLIDSDALLDLAVSTLEVWGKTLAIGPRAEPGEVAEGPNNELRDETSYSITHSKHQLRHVSPLAMLVQCIEKAILQRAKAQDGWWQANGLRVCLNDCGALRYIGTLAMTESPEANAEAAKQFFADDRRASLTDRYELGQLISATAPYLEDALALVESHVFQRLATFAEKYKSGVEAERYSLLSRIPALLRSEAVIEAIARMAVELPLPVEQPDIYSSSGVVSAPYEAVQLTALSDDALVKLVVASQSLEDGPRVFNGFSGGLESVNTLLRSLASSAPRRFLKLLARHWADLPDRSKSAMLGGAADYLLYRYGNVQNLAWKAVEDVGHPEILQLLLEELERHPRHWAGSREGATALAGCASQVTEDTDVNRVVLLAPAHLKAEDPVCGERQDDDLISTAINSARGELAEGLLSLTKSLFAADRELPPILASTVKRLAQDCHPAVRAAIIRDLAYLQTMSDLGWDLFDSAFTDDDPRVWEYAEDTLYYAIGKDFARAKPYLDRMEQSQLQSVLEPWGRLSTLAVLESQTPSQTLLDKLTLLDDDAAWDGAISVWVSNAGNPQFAADCFSGLTAAVGHSAAHRPLLQRMNALFQPQTPTPRVPLDLFRAVYASGNLNVMDATKLPACVDEWLSRFADTDPDQTMEIAEIIAGICKSTNTMPFYDPKPLGTLLTQLFREGEERELSDKGEFLRRVVALQDVFLAMPTTILGEWLRAAERPGS